MKTMERWQKVALSFGSLALVIIASIFVLSYLDGGHEGVKQTTQATVENTIKVAKTAIPGPAPAHALTPTKATDPVDVGAIVEKAVSGAVMAMRQELSPGTPEMNETAKSAIANATTPKLGPTDQAQIVLKYGQMAPMIFAGYGADMDYFGPTMLAEVGMPFVQKVYDTAEVAVEVHETTTKNQSNLLTLDEIQLAKDGRWSEEEIPIIAKIGYDTETGLFLEKASENEFAATTENTEALAKAQKGVAGALARLKRQLNKDLQGASWVGDIWGKPTVKRVEIQGVLNCN